MVLGLCRCHPPGTRWQRCKGVATLLQITPEEDLRPWPEDTTSSGRDTTVQRCC